MKSFKQKAEENRKIFEAEQKILAEQAEQARIEREWQEDEKIRKATADRNKQFLLEEQRREDKILEQQRIDKQIYLESLQPTKQIDNYRTLKDKELDERKHQKNVIKGILQGETKLRDHIDSAYRQIEINDYEDAQLREVERMDKWLEHQEAERLVETKRRKAEKIEEEKKLARWEENERLEEEEKQRMKDLREEQSQEDSRLMEAKLETIKAERLEYEEQQKILDEGHKKQRDKVNEILIDAQRVLDSNKISDEKTKLSNLHNYIYRLNPIQEHDPWTNRKQPMSILTWEEWKQVPANKLLIEEDFKRAKLLFEQDNMRGKRYYDYMWHWREARYLAESKNIASTNLDVFVDIPYLTLIAKREQSVVNIPGKTLWIDAADRKTMFSSSLAEVDLSTAKLTITWRHDGSTDDLVVSNTSSFLTSTTDKQMSIINTSASGDYNMNHNHGGNNGDGLTGYSGKQELFIDVQFPEPVVMKAYEFRSTASQFIPVGFAVYLDKDGDEDYGDGDLSDGRHVATLTATSKITGSSAVNLINRQFTATGTHGGAANGGWFGITTDGSASIDPYHVYMSSNKEYYSGIRIAPKAFFTGSQIDLSSLKIFTLAKEEQPHHGGHITRLEANRYISDHSASFHRTTGANNRPYNEARFGPQWFSGSLNKPNRKLDGDLELPSLFFNSASHQGMSSDYEHHRSTNFTHFIVSRADSHDYSEFSNLYSDTGLDYREVYQFGENNFYKGWYSKLWDREDVGTNARANSIGINTSGRAENYLLGSATGSPWPFANDVDRKSIATAHQNKTAQGPSRNQTSIICVRFEQRPIISGSMLYMWQNGGKPFMNSASVGPIGNYGLSGSADAPTIGTSAGTFKSNGQYVQYSYGGYLHEMIMFDRSLNAAELDTVNQYLSDKWQIPVYDVIDSEDTDLVHYVTGSQLAIHGVPKLPSEFTDNSGYQTINEDGSVTLKSLQFGHYRNDQKDYDLDF